MIMNNMYIIGNASELTLGYLHWEVSEHPYRGTRPKDVPPY